MLLELSILVASLMRPLHAMNTDPELTQSSPHELRRSPSTTQSSLREIDLDQDTKQDPEPIPPSTPDYGRTEPVTAHASGHVDHPTSTAYSSYTSPPPHSSYTSPPPTRAYSSHTPPRMVYSSHTTTPPSAAYTRSTSRSHQSPGSMLGHIPRGSSFSCNYPALVPYTVVRQTLQPRRSSSVGAVRYQTYLPVHHYSHLRSAVVMQPKPVGMSFLAPPGPTAPSDPNSEDNRAIYLTALALQRHPSMTHRQVYPVYHPISPTVLSSQVMYVLHDMSTLYHPNLHVNPNTTIQVTIAEQNICTLRRFLNAVPNSEMTELRTLELPRALITHTLGVSCVDGVPRLHEYSSELLFAQPGQEFTSQCSNILGITTVDMRTPSLGSEQVT